MRKAVSRSWFVVRCRLKINYILNFHSTGNERRTTNHELFNNEIQIVAFFADVDGLRRKAVLLRFDTENVSFAHRNAFKTVITERARDGAPRRAVRTGQRHASARDGATAGGRQSAADRDCRRRNHKLLDGNCAQRPVVRIATLSSSSSSARKSPFRCCPRRCRKRCRKTSDRPSAQFVLLRER